MMKRVLFLLSFLSLTFLPGFSSTGLAFKLKDLFHTPRSYTVYCVQEYFRAICFDEKKKVFLFLERDDPEEKFHIRYVVPARPEILKDLLK